MDSIWDDFDECLKDIQKEDQCESCQHKNKIQDNGCQLCLDCGLIISKLFETCEWNNYKNGDDGTYQNSGQRGDLFISDNPYVKGGSIPGFNKNSFIMKLHYQQTFTHKQKTYWRISEKLADYCSTLGLCENVLSESKSMWHFCMESGKLTRASVRAGLIASCLYYSCLYNNIPMNRDKIIDAVDCDNKGFLKGERVFMEIMDKCKKYKSLGKEILDIKENDSFVYFCNLLELPFKTGLLCNEIYTGSKCKLDSVTPKSATAGIICYVVLDKLNLKKPSKNKIAGVVNVCIPTINKVVNILKNN